MRWPATCRRLKGEPTRTRALYLVTFTLLAITAPLTAQEGIELPREPLVTRMADSATYHLCDEPYERWVAARQLIDFLRRRGLVYQTETGMHLTTEGVAVLSQLPPQLPEMTGGYTLDRALNYYIPMSAIYFHCSRPSLPEPTHFNFEVRWFLPDGRLIAQSDVRGVVTLYPYLR